MLDLTKKVLPSAVEVEGLFYPIKTDFRYWINFSKIINDSKALLTDLDFIYEDKKPLNRAEGVQQLIKFAFPPRPLPRPTPCDENVKTMDFDLDADLIFAAFWEKYGIDLTEADLHYYKFRALLEGLKETKFNEVMSFRSWKKDSKSYDQTMRELRQAWEITDDMLLTDEEKQALEVFDRKTNGSTIEDKKEE